MINQSNTNNKNIFYICGLTGGPYFPIPAIINKIKTERPYTKHILIGVKNSYESCIADNNKYQIEFLPKVKLDIASFSKSSLLEKIIGIFLTFLTLFALLYSFLRSVYLAIKYKPILIYSTGSFLAVPIIYAIKFTNFIRLTNTKVAIHQQDPILGLANKLTCQFADLKSCLFQYTINQYPVFNPAVLTPNPILWQNYHKNHNWFDSKLESFVKLKIDQKPLLLIFGGGSGSLAINNWLKTNINDLLSKFKVVHLVGILQDKQTLPEIKNSNYHVQVSVLNDMPVLMSNADLIICRAGLGSISELNYLNKPVFLIPIPDTHQIKNALLISQINQNFEILDQNNTDSWIKKIYSRDLEPKNNKFNYNINQLNQYYDELLKLI